MIIKTKLQIHLIFLSFLLILLSTILDELSLGKAWFYLHANSLVGVQSISEEINNTFRLGIFFNFILISILNTNLLFFLGVTIILVSLFLFLYTL